jgi:hypothetical protein
MQKPIRKLSQFGQLTALSFAERENGRQLETTADHYAHLTS